MIPEHITGLRRHVPGFGDRPAFIVWEIMQNFKAKNAEVSGMVKYHVRQFHAGQLITVDCAGINADLVGMDQGFYKGGMPEDYQPAETVV